METYTCRACQNAFTITTRERALYGQIDLVIPKDCVFCRWKRHFAFWVFGKFRKGKSDLSGESMITVLPEQTRYPVYLHREWHSDEWEGGQYGQDYDPARPFFEQFKNLQEKVPRPHQTGERSTECDWCDDIWDSKNCYLTRSVSECEDLMYSYRVLRSNNSIDLTFCFDCEGSSDCTYCYTSTNLRHSMNCRDCIDSSFLFDCRNCQSCFMCFNLRNGKYCIRNTQYTKEAYEEELLKYNIGSRSIVLKLKDEFEEHLKHDVIHRENFTIKVAESTGNYISECNRCVNCFHWEASEDLFNCIRGLDSKTCIDLTGSWHVELSGNNSAVSGGYNIKYSIWSDARYSEYLDLCLDCEYCFGCVGLKKKKYCILNKQYSKEEYGVLKEKIVADMKKRGEYGEFPSYEMGLAPYNRTTGMMYFPETTKEEALALGSSWDDTDLSQTDGASPETLPDNINNATDEITKTALICPDTHFRFNIAPVELAFYKRYGLALPDRHPDARTLERMRHLIVLRAYPYKCSVCGKSIEAYYPPEWGYEKIACVECYQREVA